MEDAPRTSSSRRSVLGRGLLLVAGAFGLGAAERPGSARAARKLGATQLRLYGHTFTLGDGTIHGIGSAVRGADGEFLILGGTGRYAGIQGSYLARQGTRELGGNGTAEFRLTLTRREGWHGVI